MLSLISMELHRNSMRAIWIAFLVIPSRLAHAQVDASAATLHRIDTYLVQQTTQDVFRGIAHNSRSEYDSAIADYDKSIRIDPGNAFAFYYRGIVKRNKGHVAEARADIATALQIDPEIASKVGEMTVPLTPVTTNLPQSRSVPSCETHRGGGQLVAQVPSYVDEPIEQLKRMVPGLSGIRVEAVEDASEGTPAMPARDKTASILNRTGAVIADLLRRMPNLIAKEEVKEPTDTVLENDSPRHAFQGVWDAPAQQEIPIAHFKTRIYTYSIVHKQTPGGGDAFDEFRTDAHDQPVDDSAHNAQRPFSVGFATTWLFFLPDNLEETRFRYVGEQKIDNRETYVLAFAPTPEQEGLGVVIESSSGRCSTPMQGVAWIDQSTFQIVRMQTDLLTPLLGIQLNQFRSIVEYGAVKIRTLNLTFWVPTDVETQWQTAYQAGEEFHTYSHYRLFQSTARILPADKSPSP
jgi:tetratricopeptide (TPR) repeat protein